MMNRRRFMVGLGAMSVGTAATIGSGAVTQVTGDRDVELRIASDQNAYLKLDDRSALAETDVSTGEIVIDLTNINEFTVDGEGFNRQSVTEVTGDTSSDQIFQIINQGDRPLAVAATTVGDIEDIEKPNEPGDLDFDSLDEGDVRIELFDVEDPDRVAIDEDSPRTIHPGDTGIPVGLRVIVPAEAELGDHTITIVIQATEL